MRMIGNAFRAGLALALLLPAAALAETVAVITPYLAQPGTQFYVEALQGAGGRARLGRQRHRHRGRRRGGGVAASRIR